MLMSLFSKFIIDALQDITFKSFHATAGWILLSAIVAHPMFIVVTSYKDDYRPYRQLYPRLTDRVHQLRFVHEQGQKDSSDLESDPQVSSDTDAIFVVGEEFEGGGDEQDDVLHGIAPATIAYAAAPGSPTTTIGVPSDYADEEHINATPTPDHPTAECIPPTCTVTNTPTLVNPHILINPVTPSPTFFLRFLTLLNHLTAFWVAFGSVVVGGTGFINVLRIVDRIIHSRFSYYYVYEGGDGGGGGGGWEPVELVLNLMRITTTLFILLFTFAITFESWRFIYLSQSTPRHQIPWYYHP
ncbi:hypothetical protein HK102_010556, partial [Quaeritorhiza haematococci]